MDNSQLYDVMISDIGCSTYCLNSTPLGEALDIISRYTRTVEILSDGLHSLFFNEEVCYSYDLNYAVHAPSGDANIAVENEHIRRASIEVLSELSEICDRIGARNLVIHPGYMTSHETAALAKNSMYRSLADLSVLQQERDVHFTIENMGDLNLLFFQSPDFLPVLKEYGLRFALDIGHAHLCGNLEAFLKTSTPEHVHLHDNDRSYDTHSACGTGTIDFLSLFDALPGDAMEIIEVNSPEKAEASREFLASLR